MDDQAAGSDWDPAAFLRPVPGAGSDRDGSGPRSVNYCWRSRFKSGSIVSQLMAGVIRVLKLSLKIV
ncbi:MAG: hypothetical protein DRQ54_10025 [Gammaproteobacteria bacterium]|nr:MAG: hypothetical protein DRQ54_10025 [Gammaproteobacteria bacterium]